MITFRPKVITSTAGLFSCAAIALTLISSSASTVEQCRFIQAKPDREACYERRATALAAKHQAETARAADDSKSMESLEQMKHEDEALNRQLHNICRGC